MKLEIVGHQVPRDHQVLMVPKETVVLMVEVEKMVFLDHLVNQDLR